MEELKYFNRRKFIKTGMIVGAGGFLGVSAFPSLLRGQEKPFAKLVVLHTNDTHSRLDPFPDDGSRNAGMGGVARRAALIQEIRKAEANVLLLDAGDIFQGTPYFNFFDGEPEIKAMNHMGYDAATVGNHDFDAGIENLAKQAELAQFPFLSANYDFSDTPMSSLCKPYQVFEKGPLKIGVYGLGIELEGLVPEKLYGATQYLDPVEKALQTEKHLKEELNCDLVVGLSHLGYQYRNHKISDKKLAEKLHFTNLIIGGHTHTFMRSPEEVKNAANQTTLLFQVGWAGINLGRVDFHFYEKRDQPEAGAYAIEVNTKSA